MILLIYRSREFSSVILGFIVTVIIIIVIIVDIVMAINILLSDRIISEPQLYIYKHNGIA